MPEASLRVVHTWTPTPESQKRFWHFGTVMDKAQSTFGTLVVCQKHSTVMSKAQGTKDTNSTAWLRGVQVYRCAWGGADPELSECGHGQARAEQEELVREKQEGLEEGNGAVREMQVEWEEGDAGRDLQAGVGEGEAGRDAGCERTHSED